MKDKDGVYWGWYVVAGSFLVLAAGYGARYCLGVFLKPMSVELGWPVSVVSIGASIMIFCYGVGGIFSGRLLDHVAPKWVVTFGTIFFASGFIITPFLSQPWQWYLVYGLLCGVGSSFMGAVVCGASISKWFVRKRGTAFGIASIGIGVGTMVLAPASGYVVEVYGWKAGFILLGLVVLVMGISAAQIFMGRTRPEDYGLNPDGVRVDDRQLPIDKAVDPSDQIGGSIYPILADFRFSLMTFCYSLAVMVWAMISVHQVAHALSRGIDGLSAAAAVGMVGIASIGGRFFFGVLCDRVRDAKYLAALGFAIMSLSMVVLLQARTEGHLFLYAVLYGFGYGSMAPLMPFLMADRFGRHTMGTTYGLMIFFTAGLGGSVGPFLAGYIYDRFGSYDLALQINFIALALITALILKLRPRDAALRR